MNPDEDYYDPYSGLSMDPYTGKFYSGTSTVPSYIPQKYSPVAPVACHSRLWNNHTLTWHACGLKSGHGDSHTAADGHVWGNSYEACMWTPDGKHFCHLARHSMKELLATAVEDPMGVRVSIKHSVYVGPNSISGFKAYGESMVVPTMHKPKFKNLDAWQAAQDMLDKGAVPPHLVNVLKGLMS